MKILFLDIDGVCNSAAYLRSINKPTPWLDIDPHAAELVRGIISQTRCKVVLSSTWRFYPEALQTVKKKVCPIYDVTANLQKGKKRGVTPRGLEIQRWLDKHPYIQHYAIVDDEDDFLPNQWVFKTDYETGLTAQTAEAITAHLKAFDRIPHMLLPKHT